MRKSISVVAAAAATTAATVMIGSTPAVVALEEQQQQQQLRLLEDGWYGSSWEAEPESDSGKSGKSSSSGGSSSGKSGKGSSSGDSDDDDGWNWNVGPWGPPPPPPYPPGWYTDDEEEHSGKSGKSKSSKGDGGSWVLIPPPGWGEDEDGWSSSGSDSGSSGKSGKSGGNSSGKSGKGSSSDEDDDGSWEDSSSSSSSWHGPWGPPPPPPFEPSGKSGKSKSSKGSADDDGEGWFGPWGPPPPSGKSGKAKSSKGGEWVLLPPPPGWYDAWSGATDDDSSSGSGKSGKSSSGSSGSGKSGKSSSDEEPEPESSWSPPPKVEEEEHHDVSSEAHAICFENGARVECSTWGNDGHADGEGAWGSDGHGDGEDGNNSHGDGEDALSVPFTYTVDTDGKVDPESTISSMEKAILEDVASHIESKDEYSAFSGKISTAPGDGIADDDWCGDGHAVRCSVVKGEMSVTSAAWGGDGHAASFDACAACTIVKDSMEGQDYTDIDGVTGAEYRNCDAAECDRDTVIAGATVVPPQDDDLNGGALFAIWLAALAAIALLALLLARKRRKSQEVNEDMSLISNDLDGNHFGDYEDPYANTIDVHKCTSIYCNCNSKLNETTFLPAPRTVDISRTMSENGLTPPAAAVVSQEDATELNQEPQQDDLEHQTNESRGSIMRMPLAYQSEETSDRALTPVNEIAHDSEIDTELESVADDETNIPPPPPIAFHPSYNKQQSNDEISI